MVRNGQKVCVVPVQIAGRRRGPPLLADEALPLNHTVQSTVGLYQKNQEVALCVRGHQSLVHRWGCAK